MTPRGRKVAADAPELALYDRRSSHRDESPSPVVPFDPVTVSLEPGISLVEASAGTGKTFCITLAVLRLLLDRDPSGAYRVGDVGKILVVTFTNAATDELVTRVRAALRDAVDVFSGVATDRDDRRLAPIVRLFERYGAAELPRLRTALASLDALSIFTIHGFCKRVLEESALESGTPYDATFLDDEAELVDKVARDWWRRTIYEDARLAALAVHDEWAHDAFLDDFREWRRFPGTALDPHERLVTALARLDDEIAGFGRVWERGAAAAFFAARKWSKSSPFADEVTRDGLLDAGDALARGGLARGLPIVLECTTRALQAACFKRPAALNDAIAGEPFAIACDRVEVALDAVRRAMRVSCLESIELEFDEEKRRRHLLGFDDLLRRLKVALEREGAEGQLASAIRRRWDAALIDEFQDTDPYQFPIFRTAFAGRPLFLIGDPKQAIYGFRGADVFAYMEAASRAERRYTLSSNWRSTDAMVRGVNALFARRPRPFMYDAIGFVRATAARELDARLPDDGRAALHWWFVPPVPAEAKKSRQGRDEGAPAFKPVNKGDAEARIHAATAREIVRLLRAGLTPGRIAVLVRTAYEGRDVQRVLRQANVPSIVASMGDILQSAELHELELVMRAVAAPNDGRAVRAALSTTLWGESASAIHRLSLPEHEARWQALVERLAAAREQWARWGFMRMVQEWIADLKVPERLLAFEDGERRLTNVRHAIELLHALAVEERLSPEGLLLRIARARQQARSEDAERTELRLESDADAVQIVTIHKSKGLEYDVVFCPGLWHPKRVDDRKPVLVHEGDAVVFDHGSPRREARGRLADAERLAEDLRLAYVALTRARHRCYVAWGPIANTTTKAGAWHSALGWLLRGAANEDALAAADAAERAAAGLQGGIASWRDELDALVAGSEGAMSCESLEHAGAGIERWEGPVAREARPRCRELVPAPGQMESWRVSSFTSLTANRHVEDARDVSDAPVATPDEIRAIVHRDDFMAFPAGRHAGIALHALFERADFDASAATLRPLATEILCRSRLAADEADARIDATVAMAARVLGSAVPGAGFALRDVPRATTRREWHFHLPLGAVDGATLAALFATHGGDVARRYAASLRALDARRTWGFLTGVVDLAFEHDGRWFVLDWKSNHLGAEPERYEREGLEHEMFASHYVLQYHLYVTALHRFLTLRLPGYDYERHMGGACYAFLRGIDGSGRGWFIDRPPLALIRALGALMDAGRAVA